MVQLGVVYTCLTGNYDTLRQPVYVDENWDYVCFTDDENLVAQKNVGVWKIRPLAFQERDNTRNSRYHKINPHKLFPEYEQSIWCDSNVNILSSYIFEQILKRKTDILVPVHFCRDCIYDEFAEVEKLGYDDVDVIRHQEKLLEDDGFPKKWGLAETNVLYRKHLKPEIMKTMDMWWSFVRDFSKRDQLSFTYVLWKNGYDVKNLFVKNARCPSPDFAIYPHNPKVLIVGGCGFVGAAVTERMLQLNSRVVVIDDFDGVFDAGLKKQNLAQNESNKNYKFYQGNVFNNEFLEKVFLENKPDVVFYFQEKVRATQKTTDVKEELEGIFNVLENMRKFKAKKLILGSSAAVYGKDKRWTFSEKCSASRPCSLEGAVKSAAETLIYTYTKLYGLSAICLRFFNVFGPGQFSDGVIGNLLNSVRNHTKVQLHYGEKDKRDFVYIDDVVDGIEKAWKYPKKFDVFNLASGKAVCLGKLLKLLEKILDKKIEVEFLSSSAVHVKRKVANISKAKKLLRYNPKFSLEKALERTIKETHFL